MPALGYSSSLASRGRSDQPIPAQPIPIQALSDQSLQDQASPDQPFRVQDRIPLAQGMPGQRPGGPARSRCMPRKGSITAHPWDRSIALIGANPGGARASRAPIHGLQPDRSAQIDPDQSRAPRNIASNRNGAMGRTRTEDESHALVGVRASTFRGALTNQRSHFQVGQLKSAHSAIQLSQQKPAKRLPAHGSGQVRDPHPQGGLGEGKGP